MVRGFKKVRYYYYTLEMRIFLFIIICILSSCDTLLEREQSPENYISSEDLIAVIPHHNLVNQEIDEFYAHLSERYGIFENIIIISPNHFSRSQSYFSSFPEDWEYCYGNKFQVCNPNIKSFEHLPEVKREDSKNIFTKESAEGYSFREHWVGNHFYFFERYFPESHIYSLILNIEKVPTAHIQDVYDFLESADIKGSTLYVFSVDFSHHVPEWVALFHDLKTLDYLKGIWQQTDIEVDCPNCLYLARKLALSAEKPYFYLHNRTSVDTKLWVNSNYDNTSHIYGYFHNDTLKQDSFQDWDIGEIVIWWDSESWVWWSVYGAFFWDAHFARWFSDPNNNIPQETYFQCFYQGANTQRNPAYWFNRMLYSFDYVWVNLETSIAKRGECTPSSKSIVFRTEPDILPQFKTLWFNLFWLSNNHSYDCGDVWFQATKKYLDDAWLFYYGTGRRNVSYIHTSYKNNLKIAFVWYNDVDVRLDEDFASKQVQNYKEEWYQVIVNIHWGQEYMRESHQRQQRLARLLVDAWASLIVWHHPHVVQEFEVYNDVPIFYSLGNFLFDQPFPDTLPWYMLVYSINSERLRYNLIEFMRDEKNYYIDCNSFQKVEP